VPSFFVIECLSRSYQPRCYAAVVFVLVVVVLREESIEKGRKRRTRREEERDLFGRADRDE
jgi:hypothetical protein